MPLPLLLLLQVLTLLPLLPPPPAVLICTTPHAHSNLLVPVHSPCTHLHLFMPPLCLFEPLVPAHTPCPHLCFPLPPAFVHTCLPLLRMWLQLWVLQLSAQLHFHPPALVPPPAICCPLSTVHCFIVCHSLFVSAGWLPFL